MLAGLETDTAQRLAEVADDMSVLADARGGSTADDEHDPEGVTLAEEWSRLEGLRAALEGERMQIESAVARLGTGEYGVCAVCGADIPVGRLEARPFADRCVRCAA